MNLMLGLLISMSGVVAEAQSTSPEARLSVEPIPVRGTIHNPDVTIVVSRQPILSPVSELEPEPLVDRIAPTIEEAPF